MPAIVKRRKLASTPKNALTGTIFPGINAFTKVSKAAPIAKAVLEKNSYADSIATAIPVPDSTNDRKRKFEGDEDEDTNESHSSKIIKSAIIFTKIDLEGQRQQIKSEGIFRTPQRPILTGTSPISAETPTKGARSLLNRLILDSTPTKSPYTSTSHDSILEPRPQDHQIDPSASLPVELLDLINQHAAFLTALSIHYAHNGTHSPADLRNLCPDVARAWGKRQVLLNDIRRSLGVLNSGISDEIRDSRISQLTLSDYGHGKICIEIQTGQGRAGRMARPVNEDLLNDIYVRELRKMWEQKDLQLSVQDFVEGLKMEPIMTCSSLTKVSPLLAKGQKRLEDLKAGIVVKKQEEKAKVQEKQVETVNGTRPTLLERLRAKQLHQSTLPPPPSKGEVARRQALQRMDEVVAVLAILSTSSSIGQQRISFTMPTVLEKLRDSFKTPMSKEEASTCVRLLASDIAPAWVKIVKMGKVEALVVNRDERLGELEIKERIKRAS